MTIVTKGMGAILKARKTAKVKNLYKKAAAVGVLGAGIVATGVKKIQNIIEQDYGKKRSKKK